MFQFRSTFRADEKAVWELFEKDRKTADYLDHLQEWLEANPEWHESLFYQESTLYQSLKPDQKEWVLFDFAGGVIEENTPYPGHGLGIDVVA